MKGNTMNTFSNLVAPLFLAVLVAIIIYGALAGRQLSLINSPRASLVALLVLGLTLCALGGIGQVGASERWFSPLAITGHLLGVMLLVVFISAFAGWKLPFIAGEKQAIAAVGVMMVIKYVIGTAGAFFHWL